MHAPSLPWRTFLAGAAAVVAVTGCAGGDVSEQDLGAALADDGLAPEVADCIAEEVADRLDQGELNDLYTADELDDASRAAVDAATAACT